MQISYSKQLTTFRDSDSLKFCIHSFKMFKLIFSFLDSVMNGFFTDGKFDSTKFKCYYNLLNEHGKFNEVDDKLGSVAMFLLFKHTAVLDDFNQSKNNESLEQIKKIITSLQSIIFKISYAVKCCP